MEFINTENIISQFCSKLIEKARANLNKEGKRASGTLFDQMSFDIEKTDDNIKGVISFGSAEDYWMFVDQGVKGAGGFKGSGRMRGQGSKFKFTNKMPPPSKLDNWIVRNNLAPRQNGKFTGRKISTVGFKKSIQFLLARSIFSRGIKASMYFTKPFEKEYKTLAANLVNDFKIEIDNKIENK